MPLLFLGTQPQQARPARLALSGRDASIWVDLDVRKTLDIARRLQPNARQVVIIGGSSPSELNLLDQVRHQINGYSNELQFTYLTNHTFQEISRRVATLGPENIIVFVALSRDAAGQPFISAEAVSRIAANSGAPVYVLLDTHVGTGAIGGYVTRFDEMGKQAGELGLRMLAGEHPPDSFARSDYLFDARQLRRWKIPESSLPSGSVVLFPQPSIWESYRYLILGSILLSLLEALLILALLWQQANRKRAEQTLRESEERFRLVANSAPSLIWMAGTDKHCNFFNQGWLNFTGRPIQEELGDGWVSGVHPDDVQRCLEFYSDSFEARAEFEMEYRLLRADGDYRWIVDRGVPRFASDGTFCGYIGSCVDITDRKLFEESLHALSGRLINAQEEERARIARELHDDFSQRLALLGIGLGQLWKIAA